MSDWYRDDTVTVTTRYMKEGMDSIGAEVAEHRGHQNWEADVTVLGNVQYGPGEVLDEAHFANKERALEWLAEEWGMDIPREEWDLDPTIHNTPDSIGPNGVVK